MTRSELCEQLDETVARLITMANKMQSLANVAGAMAEEFLEASGELMETRSGLESRDGH